MNNSRYQCIDVPASFSLRETCAPVWWIGERSPRHAWIEDTLVVTEASGDHVVYREVTQPIPGVLRISSTVSDVHHATWARRVLGTGVNMPSWSDPVLEKLSGTFPGMRPYSDGSLFAGIITAIIGQSVSLASAAAAQHKLAMAFNPGVIRQERVFSPLPTASQLADASLDLIRASGVTWKRAEALQFIAREQLAGRLPTDDQATSDQDEVTRALLALPMVGKWTAQSVLLWGIGAMDAHPTGDVALLNAVRKAYARPTMTMRELDALSEEWRPDRGMAVRLLWANLFGTPPAAT
jgi:3-methyladenine DNA glycosylase/8-oxoguanine DNA glycosylase